jgi:mevalonate kinase
MSFKEPNGIVETSIIDNLKDIIKTGTTYGNRLYIAKNFPDNSTNKSYWENLRGNFEKYLSSEKVYLNITGQQSLGYGCLSSGAVAYGIIVNLWIE